jgi:hypothetical protein
MLDRADEGGDRVMLMFGEEFAVYDELKITLKAGEHTGMFRDEVYHFALSKMYG